MARLAATPTTSAVTSKPSLRLPGSICPLGSRPLDRMLPARGPRLPGTEGRHTHLSRRGRPAFPALRVEVYERRGVSLYFSALALVNAVGSMADGLVAVYAGVVVGGWSRCAWRGRASS